MPFPPWLRWLLLVLDWSRYLLTYTWFVAASLIPEGGWRSQLWFAFLVAPRLAFSFGLSQSLAETRPLAPWVVSVQWLALGLSLALFLTSQTWSFQGWLGELVRPASLALAVLVLVEALLLALFKTAGKQPEDQA